MGRHTVALGLVLAIAAPMISPPEADGVLVICKRGKKKIRIREDACKNKETQIPASDFGVVGPPGDDGGAGAPGMDGADGQLRIYGDGSAGSRTVAASETLADTNNQYTDFTVDMGVTLTIPSGTVIRCTGSFTNNGTMVVETGAEGSRQNAFNSGLVAASAPAHPGISARAPQSGASGPAVNTALGGAGGRGIDESVARNVLHPGPFAGGGAGGAFGGFGVAGGGSLTVLAAGTTTNAGTITADGADGTISRSGGGGGGVVILASPTSVTNGGTISADGGDAANSDSFAGAAGGGGGGVVHYLSPSITAGTTSVAGGAPGTPGAPGSVTADPRQGGAGGGASGGDGGSGGDVSTAGNPSAGLSGDAGHVLETSADPTALF